MYMRLTDKGLYFEVESWIILLQVTAGQICIKNHLLDEEVYYAIREVHGRSNVHWCLRDCPGCRRSRLINLRGNWLWHIGFAVDRDRHTEVWRQERTIHPAQVGIQIIPYKLPVGADRSIAGDRAVCFVFKAVSPLLHLRSRRSY